MTWNPLKLQCDEETPTVTHVHIFDSLPFLKSKRYILESFYLKPQNTSGEANHFLFSPYIWLSRGMQNPPILMRTVFLCLFITYPLNIRCDVAKSDPHMRCSIKSFPVLRFCCSIIGKSCFTQVHCSKRKQYTNGTPRNTWILLN